MCVVLSFCCGKSAGWKLLTQPALLPLRILAYIVVYLCMFVYRTVLLSVVFYFNVFFLFAVNFVSFSLRATILINLNLFARLIEDQLSDETWHAAICSRAVHTARGSRISTRSPAIAEGPRDAGVPVEIW